jgi:hypothetical protein
MQTKYQGNAQCKSYFLDERDHSALLTPSPGTAELRERGMAGKFSVNPADLNPRNLSILPAGAK